MRLVFDNKFKLTDRERMLAILADCMRTDALLGRGRLGGSPDQEAVATYSVRSLYFRFSWSAAPTATQTSNQN